MYNIYGLTPPCLRMKKGHVTFYTAVLASRALRPHPGKQRRNSGIGDRKKEHIECFKVWVLSSWAWPDKGRPKSTLAGYFTGLAVVPRGVRIDCEKLV